MPSWLTCWIIWLTRPWFCTSMPSTPRSMRAPLSASLAPCPPASVHRDGIGRERGPLGEALFEGPALLGGELLGSVERKGEFECLALVDEGRVARRPRRVELRLVDLRVARELRRSASLPLHVLERGRRV